ncbi:glycosyltransferase [Cellulosimicrobium funkei]|nr:glycosyltransferase [Cellulosimicrobium funkei]
MLNMALPSYMEAQGGAITPLGGWMVSTATQLQRRDGVELYVAFPLKSSGEEPKAEEAHYRPFEPMSGVGQKEVEYFRSLLRQINPDIVHVYGTELPHSLAATRAANAEGIPLVVTIQGLVSRIAQHIGSGLPLHVIYGASPRNILLGDSVDGLRRKYRRRGAYEIETLQRANYVIGRTEWDRACAREMSPTAPYHHLDETLRSSFYTGHWTVENIDPGSILVSQGNNPLKGLHFVVEALAKVKKIYPEAHLRVAGRKPIEAGFARSISLGTRYGMYLKKRIKQLGLVDAVEFIGYKSENEMREEFLRANLFVSASVIENESNSLSEAMALGVPSVASYVGGVPDRIEHGKTGYLYQHDAPYMLAHYAMNIFGDSNAALDMGTAAREATHKRLDAERNLESQLQIYRELTSGTNSSFVKDTLL